jgi:hypothetical protein
MRNWGFNGGLEKITDGGRICCLLWRRVSAIKPLNAAWILASVALALFTLQINIHVSAPRARPFRAGVLAVTLIAIDLDSSLH